MHFSCGIVRPPYEAGSCFLQVTSGCSHNKCRFCTFYKEAPFSVSPESEIREDLQEIKDSGWKVTRIFLQGADPFLLSYDRLKRIMDLIKEYLPWGVSVGGYGRVDSVKNKSVEQLRSLKEMGYDMIVFGIESGDDAVLDKMNKGYHATWSSSPRWMKRECIIPSSFYTALEAMIMVWGMLLKQQKC